ncbi:MAG: aminopeptidase P family protein [Planctomycetes bacterium]|nr:aminopeptidase P family protein [Planctomycetota bacterium]
MNFDAVQQYMRDQRIDAWLVYDFRGNNPVLAALLPGKRWTTRRVLLMIPARGEPRLLIHHIDSGQFKGCTVAHDLYLSWQDLRAWIARHLEGVGRVAMEYAPGGSLPVVGIADAGTVELVRSFGADVVTSANLIQVSVAVWSAEAVKGHAIASAKCADIMQSAWALIRSNLASKTPINERQVQAHIEGRFKSEGLETADAPIVGVNGHAGDPHFEVSQTDSSLIKPGDWVLIDLWARLPGEENIFSDITWVGFAGRDVPARHRAVFNAVKAARDAGVACAQKGWSDKRPVQGWQVDEASREQIVKAGFGDGIRHRTGHSLSAGPKVHGMGVNIDNLETHDTRELLPGVGFTIEPGAYFPDFGVRLEIDMYVDPAKGPVITSCVQDDIVLLA